MLDIKEKRIIADSAMGTMLEKLGAIPNVPFSLLNQSDPEKVKEVHRENLKAGATLLVTNSFDANRLKLSGFGAEKEGFVKELAQKSVEIAKEASKEFKDILIAGSVGGLGRYHQLHSELSLREYTQIFKEQFDGLSKGGVDLFLIETQVDLIEAAMLIEIARSCNRDIPIILSFTYMEDMKTPGGETVEEIVDFCERMDVFGIGVNHGVGPLQALEITRRYLYLTDLPVCCMPNSGTPRYENGRFVYPRSPSHYAKIGIECFEAGCSIYGGCCGTEPEDVNELKKQLESRKKGSLRQKIYFTDKEDKLSHILPEVTTETKELTFIPLKENLKKNRCIILEAHPPKSVDVTSAIKKLSSFNGPYIDCYSVVDSPLAKIRMSPISFAYLLKNTTKKDVIVHFTLRDRSITRIQSDLLGAHALGLYNILALSGDPPSIGDYPQATAVYDLNPTQLISLMNALNRGVDLAGNQMKGNTSFFCGSAVNPASETEKELKKIKERIDAGVNFFISQPVYDANLWLRFYEKVSRYDIPFVVGIMPPRSLRQTLYLAHEVPGFYVPEEFIKLIEKSDDPIKTSIEYHIELIDKIKYSVSGIYLVPPIYDFEVVRSLIDIFRNKK